jgi:hypothetical protein
MCLIKRDTNANLNNLSASYILHGPSEGETINGEGQTVNGIKVERELSSAECQQNPRA